MKTTKGSRKAREAKLEAGLKVLAARKRLMEAYHSGDQERIERARAEVACATDLEVILETA